MSKRGLFHENSEASPCFRMGVRVVMERIPEPELMNDAEQALAYARADFEEPHNHFVELFRNRFPEEKIDGYVLDLGCGPADVTMRFARAYPNCLIHGIDGAENMLKHGRDAIANQVLESRISLYYGRLPEFKPVQSSYDVVISNSLLHHLHDPMVLWESIKSYAAPKAIVFVMDLFRPATLLEARTIVEQYAADEPALLKEDFFHSLCAGYRVEEVEEQLELANLENLSTEIVSDRHLIVYGRLGLETEATTR
jgi:ubiquinone/menaquinone biosynthesis C-methylase UbiE